DPAAYVLFLAGFVLLLGRVREGPRDRSVVGANPSTVIAGHSASEDARERAYDPAIHPVRKNAFAKWMDPRVKPAGDGELASGFAPAFAAGLLFALALFVRPNIAPAAGILLLGAGVAALAQGEFRRVAGLVVGFTAVLGMALHNWVYGGALVLFTTSAAH